MGCLQNQWIWEPSNVCRETSGAWHFTSCPLCQCNGHSNCSITATCDQPCQQNTQVSTTVGDFPEAPVPGSNLSPGGLSIVRFEGRQIPL